MLGLRFIQVFEISVGHLSAHVNHQIHFLTHLNIKIVERAGDKLQDILCKSNPWVSLDCKRENCSHVKGQLCQAIQTLHVPGMRPRGILDQHFGSGGGEYWVRLRGVLDHRLRVALEEIAGDAAQKKLCNSPGGAALRRGGATLIEVVKERGANSHTPRSLRCRLAECK